MRKRRLFTLFFLFNTVFWGTPPALIFASDAVPFAFPEVEGWKQSGEIQTFSPDDLYQYINGGADLYLAYDFQDLNVMEYQNEREATVTVEIYRHETTYHSFGVYSQERPPGPAFLAVGAQGYTGEDYLNFVAGSYYVKVSATRAGTEVREVLLRFAKKVEERLPEKGTLPTVLKLFPAEGKVTNSEKFVAHTFLGYAFLHSAFTADYVLAGKKFEIFMIESGGKNESRGMVEKYFQVNGKPAHGITEGRFTLSDPHHGVVDLLWKEGRIWGILNLDDPALRSNYLKLIEEGL